MQQTLALNSFEAQKKNRLHFGNSSNGIRTRKKEWRPTPPKKAIVTSQKL
jgi:hypothetical protein